MLLTQPTHRRVVRRMTLYEYASDSSGRRVDFERGIIRDVKVLGRRSRNGRVYSDRALQQARTLYEGAPVYLDHPDRRSPDADRPIASKFGHLKNVRLAPDGIRADLVFLKKHPLAESICEAAERMPGQLGLSHNAEGRVTEDRDGNTIVDSVEAVRSVDLVTNPATNRGLFESTDPTKGTTTMTMTPDVSKPANALRAAIKASDLPPEDKEELLSNLAAIVAALTDQEYEPDEMESDAETNASNERDENRPGAFPMKPGSPGDQYAAIGESDHTTRFLFGLTESARPTCTRRPFRGRRRLTESQRRDRLASYLLGKGKR
jgi:hypothetical protein